MNFKDFIKQRKVILCEKDLQKAKALLKISNKNLKAINKIPKEKEFSQLILTQSYESLRQVLEAITLCEGYKVYSHEAFTYYLSELNEDAISNKFDRLRKLRNGCNYYGKDVSLIVALDAKEESREICYKLEKKYLNQITTIKK